MLSSLRQPERQGVGHLEEAGIVRKLQLTETDIVKALLRSETRRSPQAAFAHRLHCLALVGAGWGCDQIAAAFGDDLRSVQRWVRRFQQSGAEGLVDAPHSGRPASLDETQLRQLRLAIATEPRTFGHAGATWSGEILRLEILQRFGVAHSKRHCARLLGLLRQPEALSPEAP